MRELTYLVAVSLDGLIAAPDGSYDAFSTEGDHMDVLFDEYADTIPTHVQDAVGITSDQSRFDTVVMGWDTYLPALSVGIDNPYRHLRQVVASRRSRTVPAGITVTADPLETVRALKADTHGTGVYLAGGGQLAATVIDEIDHLVLKINPLLLGDGIRLFGKTTHMPRGFALTSTRACDSGVVIAEYSRCR
ncbi:hypothetical protein HMPREF0063_11213 [Aeromicrobium marinum DSM 15272]|uniref:Bacterial bifunctional deaminase-reductase C-terminal domain-containing protein n=1 Tax=Aeromicrobium marinum DSM 15272 TaxID=585531 RepID=E2SB04_9ACTN|nr:dihydrofolate reductase family protein [Aeromicrobium marinum]EFQ83550.1 hypothetical protein HMPREF0063_11213 [Aeromicrobium marinum DSM 15272]